MGLVIDFLAPEEPSEEIEGSSTPAPPPEREPRAIRAQWDEEPIEAALQI